MSKNGSRQLRISAYHPHLQSAGVPLLWDRTRSQVPDFVSLCPAEACVLIFVNTTVPVTGCELRCGWSPLPTSFTPCDRAGRTSRNTKAKARLDFIDGDLPF